MLCSLLHRAIGHLTATACLHFSQAHCPRYVYYFCRLQLSLVPRLLAFQRSNDHISLSVGIAGSLFSLLSADSSCCVHRRFLSCQYHACSWTKYPSRSPLLPLHPLATLLSYCMLPYYTLLTLGLPISPTFSGAVLHRFELPTRKIHAARSCRPSWSTAKLSTSTFQIHAAHTCRPWWSTAATAAFHRPTRFNAFSSQRRPVHGRRIW